MEPLRAAPSARRGFSERLWLRTTLPIAAIGCLLLAVAVYGAWRVHRLQQRGREILAENVSSVRAAEELETVVRESRYRLKRYISTGNSRHLEEIEQRREESMRALQAMERLATTRRERHLLERVRKGHAQLLAAVADLRSDAPRTGPTELATLADEVLPNKVLLYTQRYIDLNEQEVDRNSERNEVTAKRLMNGMVLVGATGGVAGLLLGYGIARRMRRTIVQLSFPLRDVAGTLNEVVGPVSVSADPGFGDLEAVLQHISRRVELVVARLQRSEHETLRAEQLAAVGQLAAGLAHEIRNPLTSMKVIMQSAETPSDVDSQDLTILKEETVRLEKSVQMFLDFARPPQLEKKACDLYELVRQTRLLVASQADRQRIEVTCSCSSPSAMVEADVTQVRQVLLNLLLNAFDAVCSGGEVHMDVSAEPWSPGGGEPVEPWSVLRVTDSGPGLPAELGERIFEPFVSTKETGIGLGLSICKRIIETHGGQISAENGPRAGTVFTIRLPLAQSRLSSIPEHHPGGRVPSVHL